MAKGKLFYRTRMLFSLQVECMLISAYVQAGIVRTVRYPSAQTERESVLQALKSAGRINCPLYHWQSRAHNIHYPNIQLTIY